VSEPNVTTTNIFAIEKEAGFLDASFDFFGDRDRSPAHFIVGDLLDRDNEEMQALVGTVDVVHINMVLHVWDWAGQVRACERLVELLKPEKGALILGSKVGRLEAALWEAKPGIWFYKHDPESFAKLWKEVGERTGTIWEVRAYNAGILGVNGDEQPHFSDPSTRRLMFEVERL
jgi:SAM-dependent methyltransferase